MAEHVIGAVICLQRELAYADEAIKSGAYAQARERILDRGACELFDATVGIVGLGGIGRALAPRLAAFGATVVASDVFWPEDFAQEHGIRRQSDELFAVSDIVTLHCRSWTPRGLWTRRGPLP
ncbi:MAG: NAD(P)-dependent oxidoreductase [Bilophila wadsworthia]